MCALYRQGSTDRGDDVISKHSAGVVAVAVAAAMLATVPTLPAAASAGSAGSDAAATPTGTVYWAEPAEAAPNWIFPMAGLPYYSQTNLQDFQQLMYRPLYWLSNGGKPALDESLSLAAAPVSSDGGAAVTIQMKGWKWSNGTTVDARDVIFWLNMMRAEPNNWAGTVPGELPYNLVSTNTPSAGSDTLVIKFDKAYNSRFMLFSELSQVTPLPLAWDITEPGAKAGSGGCSSLTWDSKTESDCKAVWSFLTDDGGTNFPAHEAADLATYATNPLWQVVDGPWHLSGFDALDGKVTMVPSPSYSGPVKPHVAKFVELPYVSESAELSALEEGNEPIVGYLPTDAAPRAPKAGATGPNNSALAAKYDEGIQYSWSVNYFPVNFNSNGDGGEAGDIFRQLYVRQALQELVDQPGILSAAYRNYGVVDDGPVPSTPATTFLSSGEAKNQYPYSVSAAVATLKAHGWTVNAGATDVCSSATKCGGGIKAGTPLSLSLVYTSGYPPLQQLTKSEVASWAKAGIKVAAKAMTFDGVLETAVRCKASASSCSWEMANWGGGWLYEPDYDPTGEIMFASNAGANSGSYNSPVADKLITASVTENKPEVLAAYENYMAAQLPVIWQPSTDGIVEVPKTVAGVAPLSATGALTPEDWYWAT
ncbi:MAG: ABC transporter substrate-binding protein [Acidimicrobiales bacterium]